MISRKNLIPYVGFVHEGVFYGLAQDNHVVKYNEATDSWQQIEQITSPQQSFLFAMNGRIYMSSVSGWNDHVTSYDVETLESEDHGPLPIPWWEMVSYYNNEKGYIFSNNYGVWEFKPFEN